MLGLHRFLSGLRSVSRPLRSSQPAKTAQVVECSDWRQGDVFHGAKAFAFDRTWTPRELPTDHGVAIVSQSCDASLTHRRSVLIAPIVLLEEGAARNEARSGKQTHLVPLPALGEGYFADLDGITTVSKAALSACRRSSGTSTDKEVREFAFSVARRFGRFAYPDEVVRTLDPVKTAIQEKAAKPASPLGQALEHVHSFRVACENWKTPPYELTLIVVMSAEAVPIDVDTQVEPPELAASLGIDSGQPLKTQVNTCLTRLQQSTDSLERYYIWNHLADLWAKQCEQAADDHGYSAVIASVVAEVVAIDEFPMSLYLATESLDLDYLSDSRKPDS